MIGRQSARETCKISSSREPSHNNKFEFRYLRQQRSWICKLHATFAARSRRCYGVIVINFLISYLHRNQPLLSQYLRHVPITTHTPPPNQLEASPPQANCLPHTPKPHSPSISASCRASKPTPKQNSVPQMARQNFTWASNPHRTRIRTVSP